MVRNYGLKEYEKMYTEEEFNDGCNFNLWMGTGIGVVFTIVVAAGFLWYHGLIL